MDVPLTLLDFPNKSVIPLLNDIKGSNHINLNLFLVLQFYVEYIINIKGSYIFEFKHRLLLANKNDWGFI